MSIDTVQNLTLRSSYILNFCSYETRGLGPLLPDNWLDHIRVAEEFEVVNRGPITMVYTRQRDAPPLIIEPPCNSLSKFIVFIYLLGIRAKLNLE